MQDSEDIQKELDKAQSFITHVLGKAEIGYTCLSRLLHDELGGLMVGAVMDLAWAEQHMPDVPENFRARLGKIREGLRAAIDIKRRAIEELRPTILDNFGLFAALRWHTQQACMKVACKLTEEYPDKEPAFTADAAITLFRVAQDSLTLTLERPGIRSAALLVALRPGHVLMSMSSDVNVAAERQQEESSSKAFDCMYYRMRALEGRLTLAARPAGGTTITASLPIERAICA